MELKTLKDFEVNPKSFAGAMANAGRKYTINIEDLKQEAIKWIKFMKPLDKITSFEYGGTPEEIHQQGYRMGLEDAYSLKVIPWINHFFNITEEDLK